MLHISTGADWQHPRFWTGIQNGGRGGMEHPAGGEPGDESEQAAEASLSKTAASPMGGSTQAAGVGYALPGASSGSAGPLSPRLGSLGPRGATTSLVARLLFTRARNKTLAALLASERENAERDRTTAHNLVQQLREKLEAFQTMAATPTPSESAPTSAGAAPDAQTTAVADEGVASAAAARIRFLESQIEAADEALLQSQQALKAHIASLEAQACASATEVQSLRTALNRQAAMHEELTELFARKEHKLRQRIDRLEVELSDAKARLLRGEVQQRQSAEHSGNGGEKPAAVVSRSPSSAFSLSDSPSSPHE